MFALGAVLKLCWFFIATRADIVILGLAAAIIVLTELETDSNPPNPQA